MKISVIGLGKLGAPLAAVLAHKGHTVIGIDQDPRPVSLLNQGQAPVFEPDLEKLIRSAGGRLSATTDYEKAVLGTEITFIVVPTPSDSNGRFSTEFVLESAESVGSVLAGKEGFHLVVLTSTVMPGDTTGKVLPALERSSGKKCGTDFGLCYNPEFIALGTVIRDMLRPDFILIGESDSRSGGMLEMHYRGLCGEKVPIARMSFVNAELTKLAVNTFVTTKISYANMLSQMCERLPGANVDTVTQALGWDSRIGGKYLKGGLGYGGPCFPRDNVAFIRLASELGIQASLPAATDEINRSQVPRLAELVLKQANCGWTIGILGLAYKPNTEVVEASQGLELARYLSSRDFAVVVYDPAGTEKAKEFLNHTVNFASSLEECVEASDLIVLSTPWEEFRKVTPELLQRQGRQRVVIDCWRFLDASKIQEVADYIPFGIGSEQERERVP